MAGRVVRVTQFGAPPKLELTTEPIPSPGHGEVVVRMITAPVNPADIFRYVTNYLLPRTYVAFVWPTKVIDQPSQ